MQFKTYFFQMSKQERSDFAAQVGTTVGHLNNFAYGYTKLAAEVCVLIEKASECAVMRWDLRPLDWHRIWPELIGIEGAPAPAHIAQPATEAVAS